MQNIYAYNSIFIFRCADVYILLLQCMNDISINQASQYKLSSHGRSYHKLMVGKQTQPNTIIIKRTKRLSWSAV